jgi:hypothetical protein
MFWWMEDGDRSSVQNVVFSFFRIPDEGHRPKTRNPQHYTSSSSEPIRIYIMCSYYQGSNTFDMV